MRKGIVRRFEVHNTAYLINTMAAPTSNGVETEQRYIYYLLANNATFELAKRKDLYSSTPKLRELLLRENGAKVALPYLLTCKWVDVEKALALEYVFKDTAINICVYRFERHRHNKKKTIELENQAQKGEISSKKNCSQETIISYIDEACLRRNQNVTVAAGSDLVRLILKKGRLKVGLVHCQVQKRRGQNTVVNAGIVGIASILQRTESDRPMFQDQDLDSSETQNAVLYNCYFAPNAELGVFESELSELREIVLTKGKESILCEDFNLKSAVWGMQYEDTRKTSDVMFIDNVNRIGNTTEVLETFLDK
nr:unnamed protein product [Callosobruchus analis]